MGCQMPVSLHIHRSSIALFDISWHEEAVGKSSPHPCHHSCAWQKWASGTPLWNICGPVCLHDVLSFAITAQQCGGRKRCILMTEKGLPQWLTSSEFFLVSISLLIVHDRSSDLDRSDDKSSKIDSFMSTWIPPPNMRCEMDDEAHCSDPSSHIQEDEEDFEEMLSIDNNTLLFRWFRGGREAGKRANCLHEIVLLSLPRMSLLCLRHQSRLPVLIETFSISF